LDHVGISGVAAYFAFLVADTCGALVSTPEFVEHWVDGKLKLVPKGGIPAAGSKPVDVASRGPDPSAQSAQEGVCTRVQTSAGNVVGAPDVGEDKQERAHPWVEAVYRRAQQVKRRLWERDDARTTPLS